MYIILILGLISTRITADLFTEDGVLVEEGEELYKISLFWNLLVTLKTPEIPDKELFDSVSEVRLFMNNNTQHLHNYEIQLWDYRLQRILNMSSEYNHMDTVPAKAGDRQKRGFVDGIGKVRHQNLQLNRDIIKQVM